MNLDKIIISLDPKVEVEKDALFEALYRVAFSFYAAGGIVTLDEWLALTSDTREAFVSANQAYIRGKMSREGFAGLSEKHALAVGDGVDYGTFAERRRLEEWAGDIAQNLRGVL